MKKGEGGAVCKYGRTMWGPSSVGVLFCVGLANGNMDPDYFVALIKSKKFSFKLHMYCTL